MLTVLHSATEYNLAKSPMMIKIQTDDLWSTEDTGYHAECGLGFSGNPAVNDTLVVKWATGIVTFTFKTTLVNNTTLRTNLTSLSSSAFTQQVVADMLLNPTIASLFTVQASQYVIVINAKNAGPIYNFSSGVGYGANSYTNFYNYRSGTSNIVSVMRPNYGILCEIYMWDTFSGTTYKKIHSTLKKYQSIAPTTTQALEFDVQDIINAFLKYDIPAPNTGSSFLCENVLRRFFLNYRVLYGITPIPVVTGFGPGYFFNFGYPLPFSTIDGYALKGGFTKRNSRIIDKQQFTNYYHLNKAFLTRQPRSKKIVRYQPEYLYFILPNDYPGQNLCLNVTSYDSDGKVQGITQQAVTSGTLLKNSCWCFPVNYSTSFINNDPLQAPQYRVHVANVLNPSIPISEVFTYAIDTEKYIDEKILLFTNSDGGFDTLRVTGTITDTGEFDKEEYEKTFFLYDSPQEGETKSEGALEEYHFKCNTGWLTKDQSKWLTDLFLADTVVEYDPVHYTFIPIIIITKKVQKNKSQENVRGFEFEYKHAYKSASNDFLNYL